MKAIKKARKIHKEEERQRNQKSKAPKTQKYENPLNSPLIAILLSLVYLTQRGLTLPPIGYEGSYIYIKKILSGQRNLLDLDDLRKQTYTDNENIYLKDVVPPSAKTVVLSWRYKYTNKTGVVLTITRTPQLKLGIPDPKSPKGYRIENDTTSVINVKVPEIVSKKNLKRESSDQWHFVVFMIGRDIENFLDQNHFAITAFYPDTIPNRPWHTKHYSIANARRVILREGFTLDGLSFDFNTNTNSFYDIKVFFDSFNNGFIDESLLSTFIKPTTRLVLDLPFRYIDLKVFEWINLASKNSARKIQPQDQYINQDYNSDYYFNDVSNGDYLEINLKENVNQGNGNRSMREPVRIHVPSSIDLDYGETTSLNQKVYTLSFWFLFDLDGNYTDLSYRRDHIGQGMEIFKLVLSNKFNSTTTLANTLVPGEKLTIIRLIADFDEEVDYTTDNNKKKYLSGKRRAPYRFKMRIQVNRTDYNMHKQSPPDRKEENVDTFSINLKHVNHPLNDNYRLTNGKWYFCSVGLTQMTYINNNIDLMMLLSNPREKESLQIAFPGEEDDEIRHQTEEYLKNIEFKFLGRLAQIKILDGNFDISNDYNSLIQTGFTIIDCLMGYAYNRVNYVKSKTNFNDLIYEEQHRECFQCIGVTFHDQLHAKTKSAPDPFKQSQEVAMAWDGNECVLYCPPGFEIDFRSMRCLDCFKLECRQLNFSLLTINPQKSSQVRPAATVTTSASSTSSATSGTSATSSKTSVASSSATDSTERLKAYQATAICGDDIVEYSKGEECDSVAEGCSIDCTSIDGYICHSTLPGNSKCIKCDSSDAESYCKRVYHSSKRSYQEELMLNKCVTSCQYAIGSYPIEGFVKATWGKQTYLNILGEEKLCFLSYLNIVERNRELQASKTVSIRKTFDFTNKRNLEQYCKEDCRLHYVKSLKICYGFNEGLGYIRPIDFNLFSIQPESWTVKFILVRGFNLTVIILLIISLIFLAPSKNIQLFFMMIDIMQLYYIWGLRSPKSESKKWVLSHFSSISFEWTGGWIKEVVMGAIFDIDEYPLLQYKQPIRDSDFKFSNNYISQWEDFMQYKKTGYFLLDCGNIIELFLYYLAFCVFLWMVLIFIKKYFNNEGCLYLTIKSMADYTISRYTWFRILHESYIYLLLYSFYMELNMHFPIKEDGSFFMNYLHVIFNKIIMRLVLCAIGFGFPIYLIARLCIYGNKERIYRDLNFMIAGCKQNSITAKVMPILGIFRKVLMVLYVLPCFNEVSLRISLLIIVHQSAIFILMFYGRPFKSRIANIVAILCNFVFFLTSFSFFLIIVAETFIDLTYQTSLDDQGKVIDQYKPFYEQIYHIINREITTFSICLIMLIFSVGIFCQMIVQIRHNKEFYGSVFSGAKNDDEYEESDEFLNGADETDGDGPEKSFEMMNF